MIDGSEIRKRELAFELESSRVFEKRSKSSDVFEQVNRKWAFSFTNISWQIKFVLSRVFTPKRRLAQEFVQNHGRRSKSAKSPLPVVVRRSKTSIFNVERWNKSVGFRQGYRFSSGQLCTKKSCMYIYRFFSAIFAGPLFVEIQIMLPWQREVTLFLSTTVPRKFNQRLYFSLLSNLV